MQELVYVAMAFIERCDNQDSLRTLIEDLSQTLARFGFRYFMMTRLPNLGEDAEPYIIAHTWPPEWLVRYREGRFFWNDPVSLVSLTSPRPFSWSEARKASRRTRIAQQIASEARSIGLVDGVGFPMGDPSSVQAVVSLAADQPVQLDLLEREMLHLVCLHAEMRAAELYDRTRSAIGRISEREREVLRWIANGKSAFDVGTILTISERTVKEHLQKAREKLNASTTTHAVAKAIKSRQIIL
ncbi:helix-turn-helix transcriptional regulator [Devosia chinhatensis]|uniref:HTH luxR-type domain-containing protein n=1 Tax=Devosia chinhatensis TaxID=429727 RepID=A0A0F5FLH7_9HYPH|nr:LuxR family transcriptional regulator [Devosia chinhatensis]KKB09425.1 hypothetical protein VE26_05690 [Devosia chinhatensis]